MALHTGMRFTIDKSGRIVVPKRWRERLGLKPGTKLEALEQADGIFLRKVEEPPALVKVEEPPALVKIDGLWVHRGTTQTNAHWDRVVQKVREERIKSVIKA
jgi:AbrB family looped-hinge helix DNA binding protein